MKIIKGLLLATIVYTITLVLTNFFMPYSQGFKELEASDNPVSLLFTLFSSAWICFSMYFVIRHSGFYGKKLFLTLLGTMFFVLPFMTQIETLFFINAFPALTKFDVILLMFAMGLFPLSAAAILLVNYFQNDGTASEKIKLNFKGVIWRLGAVGIIYLCVYMIFGYFVAWQFEELRIFYSGSSEKLSFFQQVFSNSPGMILFQILRGVLFGIAVIPLLLMINKAKKTFIISVCLVYLCTAVVLLIPNVLFPDIVRFAHLIEMAGSMLLFGIITGNVMWGAKK